MFPIHLTPFFLQEVVLKDVSIQFFRYLLIVFLYALFCNSHNLAQRGHLELLSGATNPHSAIWWAAERTGMHHARYLSEPPTKHQGHSSSHSWQNISSILRIGLMVYLASFWIQRLISIGQDTEAESQLHSSLLPSLPSILIPSRLTRNCHLTKAKMLKACG